MQEIVRRLRSSIWEQLYCCTPWPPGRGLSSHHCTQQVRQTPFVLLAGVSPGPKQLQSHSYSQKWQEPHTLNAKLLRMASLALLDGQIMLSIGSIAISRGCRMSARQLTQCALIQQNQ